MNWSRIVPGAVVGIAALFLILIMAAPAAAPGGLSLDQVSTIPVVDGGRVKPLDTVARNALMVISNRQTFKDEKESSQPAIRWLLDVMAGESLRGQRDVWESPARNYKVFRIENDQVLKLLKLEFRPGSYRYSIREIGPQWEELHSEAQRANKVDAKQRNIFDQKVLELRQHIELYLKLAQGEEPRIIPPNRVKDEWRTYSEVRKEAAQVAIMLFREQKNIKGELNKEQQKEVLASLDEIVAEYYPAADAWKRILKAYSAKEAAAFDKAVADFRKLQGKLPSSADGDAKFEVFFNHFAPFYYSTILYVMVFLLACAAWISYPEILNRSAFWLTVFTLCVHTFALIARMYLQGRPPVTNLYSSAVFIGWGGVGLGLFLEYTFRNGIGTAVASILGGGTALIAHHLAETGGDTLEMMQAVLDTNFWLATHVTIITLGYAATLFAGLLGMMFIAFGLFTNLLNQNLFRALGQMMYGVLCFATLLSFVGTVLGGIWADQSWGRFWGWDPKENGALLIVLMNSLILHARWGGMIKQRGMAVLTLVGNMVTGWSWFGTNQLGVGLHAYGFNNTLAAGLTIWWICHLVAIGIGLIPTRHWGSYGQPPASSTRQPSKRVERPDRTDRHGVTAAAPS